MPDLDSRALQPVGKAAEGEPVAGETGQTSSRITTCYARVEVVPPGVVGLFQVDCGSGPPHVDHLTQYVQDSLGVPGDGRAGAVCVAVLLGWGSGGASTLKAGGDAEDQSTGALNKDGSEVGAAGGILEASDGAEDQAAGAPIKDSTVQGAVGGTRGVCVTEPSKAAPYVRCVTATIVGEQPVGASASRGPVERGSGMYSARTRDEGQAMVTRAGDGAGVHVKVAADRPEGYVVAMGEGVPEEPVG